MVNDVNPVQEWKAKLPIVVTEPGIVTDVSPLQPKKAESPIDVTDPGIVKAPFLPPGYSTKQVKSLLKRTPSAEEYIGFSDSTSIVIKLRHSAKAPVPIKVAVLGMAIDVRLLQPLNAESPIVVTEFGMLTDVSPLQRLNAESPIVVTEFGMVIDVRLLHF